MWRKLRIAILLLILSVVIHQNWREEKDLDWKNNFEVAVYPVNADGSTTVKNYLRTLTREDFEPVADYFTQEAHRFNIGLYQPISLQLGTEIQAIPPAPPKDNAILNIILWSLKFKYYAWQNSPKVPIKPKIRLYLLYYNPITSPILSHSTALNKGRIGRVNLFGDTAHSQQNLVIVAHELLHTLNATDKYDLTNTLPIYPEGYAEPYKTPLYPQTSAELMGGRVALTKNKAAIPESLKETIIGNKTAREIGWLK